jgi:solute carrier family 25 (mitochondrial S-adenosylmethionine transporter), member 26
MRSYSLSSFSTNNIMAVLLWLCVLYAICSTIQATCLSKIRDALSHVPPRDFKNAEADCGRRKGSVLSEPRTKRSLLWPRRAVANKCPKYTPSARDNMRKNLLVAASGGTAGGLATALLYPLDTLKTIRQSDRSLQSFGSAIAVLRTRGLNNIYSGVIPTMLGSFPSSALYFGAYEGSKQWLFRNFGNNDNDGGINLNRPTIHMLAAASGNIISSLVFVPKETIKQRMQAINSGAMASVAGAGASGVATTIGIGEIVRQILTINGLKGFYPSYRATLMRNIPSAVVRFTVYEELKHLCGVGLGGNVGVLLVGGVASALSSACTTPIDVVKTRLATGMLPSGTKVLPAIATIARQEGAKGLFSGVQERALWSALFGGVGLTCFESCKSVALEYCATKEKEAQRQR